jgi:DNA/RNA-binding domain of Phe-tRNA-synthetase-like protein
MTAPEDVELTAAEGFVEPDLLAEFPGLRLDWVSARARRCASPRAVRQRLKALSDRYRGDSVVAMRTQAIPHAYRSFFRQIGLDPDTNRIPSEEAAVARLLHGEFRSCDLVDDALLIALVETGVPVWALDADVVDADGLGIRTTVDGDRMGVIKRGGFLRPGTLAVADARCVHAVLFGEVAPGHDVGPNSTGIVLFSVGVPGVPAIHVEEALWVCSEVLGVAS